MNKHQYIDGSVVPESARRYETQDFREVADEVLKELKGAAYHFPPMRSPHEGWAIIREEVDEMWDEVKASKPIVGDPHIERSLQEAKQVAAMAIRYIHDIRKEYK